MQWKYSFLEQTSWPILLLYFAYSVHVLFSSNKQPCRIMWELWSFPLLCPMSSWLGPTLQYSISFSFLLSLSSFFSVAAHSLHPAPTLLSLSALSAFLQMNHFFASVFVKRKKQSKTNELCEMSRRLLNNSLENGALIASLMGVFI